MEQLISQESIAAQIRFLADDLVEGRGLGSRGDRLARLYIQTQMQLFGLQPGGVEGGWEQPVPMLGLTAQVQQPLRVQGDKGQLVLQAPADYTAEAGNLAPESAWDQVELVFVGYGITAPEQDWDDFKDVDVRGKVLLVMNNDPSQDPELFAGPKRLYYGRWSYKYEEAARRGAVGAIVIHTTASAGYPFQVIQAGHGQEDFWLQPEEGTPLLQLRSWCSEEAAQKSVALGGHDLDVLRAAAEKRDFKPVPLGVKVSLQTKNKTRPFDSANVLGLLPGTDAKLKDQVIVVTAHFDHLGIGTPKKGDAIYNGALDNASGVAAMLSLVRACVALETKPRRSILFAAVTGEESGLLGSLFYARQPTFPRRQLVANFNLDSINIWGETRDIAMVGHGKNSLTALAEEVATRRGRELVPNPDTSLGLFYRSDHFSFARHGIPSAYFKVGSEFLENRRGKNRVKGAYTRTRYHQPSDEYLATWDLRGAVADTRLVLECLLRAANDDQEPRWTPGDEFESLR